MGSVCGHSPSLNSGPGPGLCPGGQGTEVAQMWTLVQPERLEYKLPSPEHAGQTVIRALKKGQRVGGSLQTKTQLLRNSVSLRTVGQKVTDINSANLKHKRKI